MRINIFFKTLQSYLRKMSVRRGGRVGGGKEGFWRVSVLSLVILLGSVIFVVEGCKLTLERLSPWQRDTVKHVRKLRNN